MASITSIEWTSTINADGSIKTYEYERNSKAAATTGDDTHNTDSINGLQDFSALQSITAGAGETGDQKRPAKKVAKKAAAGKAKQEKKSAEEEKTEEDDEADIDE